MNFNELSTRYQIAIGKILVKYGLEWDDIPASSQENKASENITSARHDIVVLLVSERILTTFEIGKLLMTPAENIGRIYNESIRPKPPEIITEPRPAKKTKPPLRKMKQANPPEDEKVLHFKDLKTDDKTAEHENILKDIRSKFSEQPIETLPTSRGQVMNMLKSQKKILSEHLDAIDNLMRFYEENPSHEKN